VPRKKAARGRQRPQATVRRKPPARRKLPPVKAPAGTEELTPEDLEIEADEAAEAVAAASIPAAEDTRRPAGGGAGRRKRGAGSTGADA